jgi:hypothetical protein
MNPEIDPRDARWWELKEGEGTEPHDIIWSVLGSLRVHHTSRAERNKECCRFYGVDMDNHGEPHTKIFDDRLTFNQAENTIDTVVSKVCKSRILPMAITTGGTWSERRKAKLFNRFIEGLFESTGVYDNDTKWEIDCHVQDCAVAKVYDDDGQVAIERVQPNNIRFDPGEAACGTLNTIYQVHYMDRLVLLDKMEAWGCDDDDIAYVKELRYTAEDDQFFAYPHQSDLVMVVEAWHRKVSRRTKGKHSVIVKGRTLINNEPYNLTKLPFLLLTYKPPIVGVTCPSLMLRLISPQKEYDKITEKLRESHEVMGVPRLIANRDSNIALMEVNDIPGSIILVDGSPNDAIHEWNATPATSQTYEYRTSIVADMLASSGIPELNAHGSAPEGIKSGKAIQLLDDIVAERLSAHMRVREKFYVDMAELALEVVRGIVGSSGEYKVFATNSKRVLDEIDFQECDIPVGSYRLKVFPTSFLSKTPAARYDMLSDMRQRGDIDEIEFRQLLDMPDLDSENDMETATADIIDMCVDAILTKGMVFVAEPFDDHQLIVRRGMKAYNLARVQRPSDGRKAKDYDKRLRALSDYITSAAKFMLPPQPPAGAGPAGAGPAGAPPAGPTDTGLAGMVPPQAPGAPLPPNGPPPQGNPYGNPMESLSNMPMQQVTDV